MRNVREDWKILLCHRVKYIKNDGDVSKGHSGQFKGAPLDKIEDHMSTNIITDNSPLHKQ